MKFPYHTKSVSQHADYFKPKILFYKTIRKKFIFFSKGVGGGYPFAEYSAKIINFIFDPFPKILKMLLLSQDRKVYDPIELEEEEPYGPDVLKRLVLSDWMRNKRGEELTNRIITALPLSHAFFFKI